MFTQIDWDLLCLMNALSGYPEPEYVDSPGTLDELLDVIAHAQILAIDTEFIRERTYYPQLCLIQIAAEDRIWCVDTIAVEDLDSLYLTLSDPSRLKVIHAGRQDLEIFFNVTGDVPSPLFDTQIGAALLGRPDQIAYAGLVAEFYALELDKSASRTNWAQRPLTEKQLKYAAADVQYLEGVKQQLEQELETRGRMSWLQEECARLTNVSHYQNDPHVAWRRLKGIGKLDRVELGVLAALASWRETKAQVRDMPRGWVLKDDRLIALARAAPQTKARLLAFEGLPPAVLRRYSEELLEVIQSPMRLDDTDGSELALVSQLTNEGKSLAQRLLEDLRKVAQQTGVSATLVASRRDIEMAICGDRRVRLFEGWRYDLFGYIVRERIEASALAGAGE